MIRLSFAAALAVAAALTTPAFAQSAVDMGRFDGRWFEIIRSPNDLQKSCRRAQIDLTPQAQANRYGMLVTCLRSADGQTETLRANARVADPGTNRRLRMTLTGLLGFGGLAGQTYVIQDHAPDYSWAILAVPDKSDWWIWHRNQNAPAATRTQLTARARGLGLDTGQLVQTGQ